MPKHPRFQVTKSEKGWCVNVPAKLAANGKRERHFHATRDLAMAHSAKLRSQFQKHGAAATLIRPSLAEAAVTAEALLQPLGISLVEAARMVVDLKKRESASRRLDKAAEAWLLSCEGLRPRTLGGYRQTIARLKEQLGERLLSSISAEELQQAVAPLGSSGAAARGRVRNTKAFWNWCSKKGWCQAETFLAVEMPRPSTGSGEIMILTPGEAEQLLRVAEHHYPQAVASYALLLFAGIRMEELSRLEAKHVSPEGIELPAEVTKKGRRRHITPNLTLQTWLAEYPFEPCTNWEEVHKACRRLAGWNVRSRLLKENDLPKAERGRWSQNALRHSHASYAVAMGTRLESLLFEFGHTGGSGLLKQHYVGRATKKQAIAFFAIGPRCRQVPSITAA